MCLQQANRLLTTESAGAGAINRVIDIECKAADSVVKDGFRTSSTIKQNYGFAGKQFIESLNSEDFEKLKEQYQLLLKELSQAAPQEKAGYGGGVGNTC